MKKIIYLLLFAPLCIELPAQSMVPKAPKLNLDSYILIEANTNTVIAEFNQDNQIAPASMTKVMSGYVIADQIASGAISLDDNVLISEKAWKTGGSKMFIEAGKRVSVRVSRLSGDLSLLGGLSCGATPLPPAPACARADRPRFARALTAPAVPYALPLLLSPMPTALWAHPRCEPADALAAPSLGVQGLLPRAPW